MSVRRAAKYIRHDVTQISHGVTYRIQTAKRKIQPENDIFTFKPIYNAMFFKPYDDVMDTWD